MRVTTRNTNSAVAVLDLHGQLTLTSDSRALDRSLKELVSLRVTRVLLNLSDVTMLDCSGVGHLLRARAEVTGAGGSLAICGLNYRIRRIFELFDLGQVFNTFESDKSAVASFFRQHPRKEEASSERATDRKDTRRDQRPHNLWGSDLIWAPASGNKSSKFPDTRLSPTVTSRKANFRRM